MEKTNLRLQSLPFPLLKQQGRKIEARFDEQLLTFEGPV